MILTSVDASIVLMLKTVVVEASMVVAYVAMTVLAGIMMICVETYVETT